MLALPLSKALQVLSPIEVAIDQDAPAAEIDAEAWETLYRPVSRPFPRPSTGRIAVKVINHLGDEVMKVFPVDQAARNAP